MWDLAAVHSEWGLVFKKLAWVSSWIWLIFHHGSQLNGSCRIAYLWLLARCNERHFNVITGCWCQLSQTGINSLIVARSKSWLTQLLNAALSCDTRKLLQINANINIKRIIPRRCRCDAGWLWGARGFGRWGDGALCKPIIRWITAVEILHLTIMASAIHRLLLASFALYFTPGSR